MAPKNHFYVYILFRPWDGTPFYVGKGSGPRWMVHEWNYPSHYNRRIASIFKKAKALNLEVPRVKIRGDLTEADAFDVEVAFIKAIGRGSLGPLVNLTDGGEGVSGFTIPKSSIEARSEKRRGRILSEDHKQKIAVAHLGKICTPEHRANVSKSLYGNQRCVGRAYSPETLAKKSVAALGNQNATGTIFTDEYLAASSKRMKDWWADPAYRSMMLAARKKN